MKKIQKPKIMKALEPYTIGEKLEEAIEKVEITNQKFNFPNLEELEIDGCKLNHVEFISKETSLSIIDSIFSFCDCSNLMLSYKSIIRSTFQDSKFVGLDANEEKIRDVIFENCDFTLANFTNTKFQNVLFKNCLVKDTRFFTCQMDNVEFQKCQLINIENIHTPLKNVDISSSILNGGKFCLEDLQGAIIDSSQAIDLVHLLGVIIKDEN